MRGTRGGYSRGGFQSSYRGSNYRGNTGGGHSSYNNNNHNSSYGHPNAGGSSDRGGRYAGNSGGGFRGGRGGFHNNDSFNNSPDTGSRFPKPVNRYQSNDRPNEYYKRPHQTTSRDRSPDRKRNRSESSRRNDDYGSNVSGSYHRGGGGGGGDSYDSNRYDNRRNDTRNSSSSSSMNRSSFRENTNSSATFHPTPHRERNMGPPTSYAPTSRLRGGRIARGTSSYRGTRGVGIRGRTFKGIPMSHSGRMAELAAQIRRKKLRGSPDAERKMNIDKLRSSIKKNNEESETAEKADTDWEEDDDEIGNLDIEDSVTFAIDDDDEVKETSDEVETEPVTKSQETSPKAAPVRKPISKESNTTTVAKTDDAGVDNGVTKEANPTADESVTEEEKTDETMDEVSPRKVTQSDENSPEKRRSLPVARTYVKLRCVHCDLPIRTFNMYTKHLLTLAHKRRLRIVQNELQLKLKTMRKNVRIKLRRDTVGIEESELNLESCQVCKANVFGGLAEHNRSRAHLEIKRMIFPACTICDVRFTHMMDYELHRCSLKHLKQVHQDQQQSSVDRERDVDWKEFTTVDCVGDVDGDIDDKDDSNGGSNQDDSAPSSNGEHITVGSEFVKDVQVKYCDLCLVYLPRDEDAEMAMKKHCAKRSHLNNYLDHKENERIRMAAVKIHQQEKKNRLIEKNKREDAKLSTMAKAEAANADKPTAKNTDTTTVNTEDEDAINSQIWEDVDKDLGELLQAVSSENAHDDEDEEDSTTTTERYDRFKNSESGGTEETGGDVRAKVDEGETVVQNEKASGEVVTTSTTK